MSDKDPQAMTGMLTAILQPWHDSVDDPAKAQQEVLHRLLKGYAQTDYGAQHGAAHIETVADYRRAFPVVIREIYGTTEGMFGQQRDEHRAWVPNYDLFFFEVQTRPSATLRAGLGLKMLHEMRAGEVGSLVVSTPILPRYKIGDLILAFRPPYFRCIGRDRWWTPLRYAWGEFSTFNLGRL